MTEFQNKSLVVIRITTPISCAKGIFESSAVSEIQREQTDRQTDILDIYTCILPLLFRFKTTVTDSFWQENNGNINELSNNRLYRNLNLESIDYLKLLPNNFIRIAITKLRLGSHYFMIERGRWKKLELIDRQCIFCNEIEDEYHIVMCCKRYNNLRKKYLPKTLIDKPSMFKFVNFLNTKDIKSLKNLGLFIFNVFKLYEENELYGS